MSKSVEQFIKAVVIVIFIGLIVLLSCDKDKVSNYVYNGPPHVTYDETINAAPGWTISDTIDYLDSSTTIKYPYYKIIDFNGPIYYGDGLQLDTATGVWSWDIPPDQNCSGDYNLIISISDLRKFCNNPFLSFSDSVYYVFYNISVSGIGISIEVIHDQLQGHEAEVSISLNSSLARQTNDSSYLYLYNFMIGYDTSVLTFVKAHPGAAIIEYKFDYFNYFIGPFDDCSDDCPSGMLGIAAIQGPPISYYLFGPGELAKITFLVSNDYNYAGKFVPIQFYWRGCDDNKILEGNQEVMLLGQNVYDHAGNLLSDSSDNFGYSGPEDSCYDTVLSGQQSFNFKHIPAINFCNGGIAIIPVQAIDDRGDVNLNGIINEIADAVVFINYFIYGPEAFTINFESQKAATDINGDGVPLTVADFVYLIRIIVGDALPMPLRPDPCALAGFSVQGGTVRVETNVDLGAVWLLFSGTITPELANDAGHMDMGYYQTGNTTRVFIYSLEQNDFISSGELLYFTGEASLDSVETAEYRGTAVNTIIE